MYEKYLDGEEAIKSNSKIVVYIMWFFWFLNSMIITIIVLNFLIAEISSSYEKTVMSKLYHTN